MDTNLPPAVTDVTKWDDAFYESAYDYKLPPPVSQALESWVNGADAIAVITVLVAGIQGSFIAIIQNQKEEVTSLWLAFRFFVYMGVFFDLGATASAVYILVMGSGLPVTAREMALRDRNSLPYEALRNPRRPFGYTRLDGTGDIDLLKRYGMGKLWVVMAYYMVVGLVCGFMCLFVSILLWVWGTEARGLAIALTIGVTAGAAPMLGFIRWVV